MVLSVYMVTLMDHYKEASEKMGCNGRIAAAKFQKESSDQGERTGVEGNGSGTARKKLDFQQKRNDEKGWS